MDGHADIRELLALAASGALAENEQRRVEDHLRQCPDCRAELAVWQRIASSLEAMPTSQAPPGLVECTRVRMANRAAILGERRHNRNWLVGLVLLAWMSTLLMWPLFRFSGGWLAGFLDVSWTTAGMIQVWLGSTVVTWMAGAAAALLGAGRQQDGRTL